QGPPPQAARQARRRSEGGWGGGWGPGGERRSIVSERAETTTISTPLTELLRIRHPVVQAAMGYVSGPRLAAATSNAGGLGLIASATMSLAELKDAIAGTADRTGAPFG